MARFAGFLLSAAFRTLLIGCAVYLYMETANPALARRVETQRFLNAPIFSVMDRHWDRLIGAANLPVDWRPELSMAPRLLRQARARRGDQA